MTSTSLLQPTPAEAQTSEEATSVAEIAASCRVPLLIMFLSAAVWGVLAALFAFIASLKFHVPGFLADSPWLTYGRVRPAATNCLLYGFGLQAGLAVVIWLFARLGRARVFQPIVVSAGAALWNGAVTLGVVGILAGDSTGYESLEMPGYAAVLILLAYLVIGVCAALTFHYRQQRELYVSQWYSLAALFWFPWIYSTAYLLLVTFPVRGVAQAVIAYWYANNLQVVWMGLVGLAVIFYFLPRLLNRPLNSHYLALFIFWMLLLFGTWGGIPNSSPLPAWMPAFSTGATIVLAIPLIAVALTVHNTIEGRYSQLRAGPLVSFVSFAVIAFLITGLMNICSSFMQTSLITDLTWFVAAKVVLGSTGFFAFTLFAAAYYIVPQLVGIELPLKRMRLHFALAAIGVVLFCVPLAIGGIVQGFQMNQPAVPFMNVLKTSLAFIRTSTMGDVFLLLSQIIFCFNLFSLTARYVRSKATVAYSHATADLYAGGTSS